jgi:hypothetical protein
MQGTEDFPKYNYADELASPRELGITRDGSFDGIMRAVSGINYYSDSIGFGEATGLAKMNGMDQTPLGIRFFTKTGMKCSNGQVMYEYVDTVPKGDLLGKRVSEELKAMELPQLRGLAPGILEDATSALNPIPLLESAVRGGFPKCKQITMPVGNEKGELASRFDKDHPWITGPVDMINGVPTQTRWVLDSWMTPSNYAKESGAAPPENNADGLSKFAKGNAEAFQPLGCPCSRGSPCRCSANCPYCTCRRAATTTISLKTSQVAAAVLLAAVVGGVLYSARRRL